MTIKVARAVLFLAVQEVWREVLIVERTCMPKHSASEGREIQPGLLGKSGSTTHVGFDE